MAGEASPAEAAVEAVAEARIEGAEAAAAVAEVQVAAVVAEAAAKVEAAEDAAAAMASAMAQTETVQRIRAIEEGGCALCRGLESRLTEQQAQMTATLAQITASLAHLTEMLVEEVAEEEPLTPGLPSSTPGESPEHAEDQGGPERPKRRHRLI